MVWSGTWPPWEVEQSRERLCALRSVVDQVGVSEEVQGPLARFLTVRSCGHVEFTFDQCLSEFASRNSHPAIAAHVKVGLFRGRNPRPHDVADRMRVLQSKWGDELDEALDENDGYWRRELALLVDRRNSIAHGQNEGVTTRKAIDLAGVALDIGDWITVRLKPSS